MLQNSGEEKQILDVYDKWLFAYLHGDIGTYGYYFADDYHFIGSTNNEEFLNKEETIRFFVDTAEQLDGKTDIRNSKRTVEYFQGLYFITEVLDAYFLSEGNWTYYGRFRFSSVLQKKTEGWRFIYQHFSTPDSKAQDGETIGYQQVSEENLMLREAIKRRTIELEQKNRELEIDTALERVRARTMAMQHSDEILSIVTTLYQELTSLAIPGLGSASILLRNDEESFRVWDVTSATQKTADVDFTADTIVKINELHPRFYFHRIWHSDKNYMVVEQDEPDFQFAIDWLTGVNKKAADDMKAFLASTNITHTWHPTAALQHGKLVVDLFEPPKPEMESIITKMGSAFDLAYKRFLDLQKAEASAREARIEAALERLRSKTMAMKNSDDVGETVATMFAEFVQLGVQTSRCGILIFENEEKAEVWTAKQDADGKATLIIGELNPQVHDLIESGYYAWKEKQLSQSYLLQGENLINYYDALNRSDFYPVKFDLNNLPAEEFNSKFFFPDGAVFSFATKPLSDEEFMIMKRFAGVFGQTYRRYLDLKKAEASAKEAIKQASLDRIRANIASMRTKQDLDRITPVIWNELTTLSIPFVRCGIFIMNDEQHQIHTFLSTPKGEAIASFNLPYDHSSNISDIVSHWQKNKTYAEHWQIVDFAELAESLVQLGEIDTREQYLQSLPPEGIYLHFVPFLQGMLYVGNLTRLSNDDLSLLQVVADAFSTAYARYEDFKKVEKTLADLRQAQSQLIQAEKMASLGELTAGIAHEIQNPLNFVNNFSEVNKELLEEVKTQTSKVKIEELDDLLDDIFQNNEKINQHGKRADAIVKGMLQHSRSSSGVKEPTDINALAEEYLRLAYHGLKAKDKSFNTAVKTDFDENIGNIKIIPQDIGRVLLNLINNAFYAVDEKKKQIGDSYEPAVSISTRLIGASKNQPISQLANSIMISVRDNGNGIPDNIRNKIFQPFFTTKPTGQGTGLGLSLSYDIVKAHGGELNVESKEGEGTVFSIILPV